MQCCHQLADLATLHAPVHWAMGFFDGLHRGHQRVIESASTPGALRGVLTFSPHPLAILRPEAAPRLITAHAEHKRELMVGLGVDILLELPFTAELAAMEARDFLDKLCAACPQGVAGISVGNNWHFGRGGRGDVTLLRQIGAEHGFRVCVNDLLTLPSGETICSSAIRSRLADGDLRGVEAMLGRAFEIVGTVESGQRLARKLGFPTANIALPAEAALPPFGVYEVSCEHEGRHLRGIANLGLRPTIREEIKQVRLETHLLDFAGDLYGSTLTLALRRFLRQERPFPSLAALQAQISADIEGLRAASLQSDL